MSHFLKFFVAVHKDIKERIFDSDIIDSLFFSIWDFFEEYKPFDFIDNIEHIVYVEGSDKIFSALGNVSSSLNTLSLFLSLIF